MTPGSLEREVNQCNLLFDDDGGLRDWIVDLYLAIRGERDLLSLRAALLIADVICILSIVTLAYAEARLDCTLAPVALLCAIVYVSTLSKLVLLLTGGAPFVDLLLTVHRAIDVGTGAVSRHEARIADAALRVSEIHAVQTYAVAAVCT
jgi:hypothetical protein